METMSFRTVRQGLHRWALIAVVLLSLGFTPGRWHCADGQPCDVASLPACCCGCPEDEERARPSSVEGRCEPEGAVLTAAECGCYRDAFALDASAAKAPGLDDLTPPATLPTVWVLPAPDREVFRVVPAAAHGPPRRVTASGAPRAPPIL